MCLVVLIYFIYGSYPLVQVFSCIMAKPYVCNPLYLFYCIFQVVICYSERPLILSVKVLR